MRYELEILKENEWEEFTEHLLRLDSSDRRCRFGLNVNDEFIKNFSDKLKEDNGTIIYVVKDNYKIIGACQCSICNQDTVEIGLSIDKDHRGNNLSENLFKQGIKWSRENGYNRIFMLCLRTNKAVQRLAKKNNMVLDYDFSECFATLKL